MTDAEKIIADVRRKYDVTLEADDVEVFLRARAVLATEPDNVAARGCVADFGKLLATGKAVNSFWEFVLPAEA